MFIVGWNSERDEAGGGGEDAIRRTGRIKTILDSILHGRKMRSNAS